MACTCFPVMGPLIRRFPCCSTFRNEEIAGVRSLVIAAPRHSGSETIYNCTKGEMSTRGGFMQRRDAFDLVLVRGLGYGREQPPKNHTNI